MKRMAVGTLLSMCVLLSANRCDSARRGLLANLLAPATINVDPSEGLGDVSPYIFGVALEWTENGTRVFDPAAGRLRPEIMEALRPLRIPVWRFPGGILADYYDWHDGIGPRDKRPVRKNPMDNAEHPSNFGTDEFIDFCRQLDTEPLVTLNFGTGSLDLALDWQKYFESRGFPVRYWEVGNEVYLADPSDHAPVPGNDKRIYHTSREYAEAFERWSAALKAHVPEALVGAIAGSTNTSPQNKDWLQVLCATSAKDADFICLHNAFAPLIFGPYDYRSEGKRVEAYRAMFAQADQFADDTRHIQGVLPVRADGRIPRIAITEHFPLFGGGGDRDQTLALLDQSKTLASGLYTASLFHSFMRTGVWMANYNIAISKWFGALLTDTDRGLIRTPSYHVYDLYRNHFGARRVKIQVTGPTFGTGDVGMVKGRPKVAQLDAVASKDDSGRLYLAVINRNLTNSVGARIEIAGRAGVATAEVLTLTGPSPSAINGPSLGPTVIAGSPDAIRPRRSSWKGVSGSTYAFPPRSVTIFRWDGTR